MLHREIDPHTLFQVPARERISGERAIGIIERTLLSLHRIAAPGAVVLTSAHMTVYGFHLTILLPTFRNEMPKYRKEAHNDCKLDHQEHNHIHTHECSSSHLTIPTHSERRTASSTVFTPKTSRKTMAEASVGNGPTTMSYRGWLLTVGFRAEVKSV